MARAIPLVAFLGALLSAGCDDPLRRQPSIMPHDPPIPAAPAGAVSVEDPEPAVTREAAALMENPLPDDPATREAGGVAYRRFCRHCHGDLGRGFTSVGASLDPAPRDLVETLDHLSDGELFGVITFGSRTSPPLGPHVTVDDRWRIVRWLRTLPDARRSMPTSMRANPWGQ